MSKLAVGSIEGLASEGYVISVPSGSKIVQTGGVLQVKQTIKTDVFSTTSASYVDVTGLNVSITPSSTSSKILIIASVGLGAQAAVGMKLTGGNIATYVGDAAGNRKRGVAYQHISTGYGTTYGPDTNIALYLDSPATTASTTYQVQIFTYTGYTAYVNRSHNDSDITDYLRGVSSIVAMEIAG